jgi:spermidine/putrescine transport system ATP-binding protein
VARGAWRYSHGAARAYRREHSKAFRRTCVLARPDIATAPSRSREGELPDLRLREVTKRFGDVVALDAVSLDIERGEFVTLLGPSGCGKTTTLRIVAGFEAQTTGSVSIRGERVDGVPPYRRNVNTVFQSYALFPHLSVFENVAFGLRVRAVPAAELRRAVGRALDQVRLGGLDRRRPHELSGGQQQRVALARALVNEPAILLLDEPLGALDLKLRKEMQLELKRVHREVGITFIYVTHDQEEALTMSDRIAVMDAGRVVQLARPREIYEQPRTTFVASFVGVSNLLPAEVRECAEGRATIEVDGGWRFAKALRRPPPVGEKVLVAVRPEKVRVARAGRGLPGRLEDFVYLGSRVTLVVRLGGDRLMQLEDPAAQIGNGAGQIGQPIAVEWDEADCLLFAARGERIE